MRPKFTLVSRLLTVVIFSWSATELRAQSAEDTTVRRALNVLDEVMSRPNEQIPIALLNKAQGVVIVPGLLKGGFVVGIGHGRGVMLLRDEQGDWQPPSFVTMTGGSVGWQVGVQAIDVILVFRTRRSVENLVQGKFTVGVGAAAAAGPLGRETSIATDAGLQAEIYTYSRSKGLFAGVALDGSAIQVDYNAGRVFYRAVNLPAPGQPLPAGTVVPESAATLVNRLTQHTAGAQAGMAGRERAAGAPVAQPNPAQPFQPGVQVAASPVGGAPAKLPANLAQAGVDDNLRRQLGESLGDLNGLLDETWRKYLNVGTLSADKQPTVEELKKTLGRFDAVAADARYAPLSRRAEFSRVHELLRQYVEISTAASAKVNLPPPPAGSGNVPAGSKY